MKFQFVGSIASYVYAISLVSFLGGVSLNLSHHVIALEDYNDTSLLTEAYQHNQPPITQYKQHLSSSDPPSFGIKEKNGAVVKTSTIQSSSSSNPPITQDNPLPVAVLNQGTLSDQLLEPAAAVVTLAEEATSTLQQRATSQSLDAVAEDSNATGKSRPIDNALPSVILLPGSSDPPPVVRALPKVIPPKETSPEPPPKGPKVAVPATAPTSIPPTQLPDEVGTTAAPQVPPLAPEVPQEDIPSFSEWTQKQLEEAEKKAENRTAFPGSGPAKLRSKNYASPDCGAKVVATNPEAENPSGVLSSSRDDYLINTCTTTRQWIVIELCEAIQAKKLELANLELFSSSPKEFSVSLSRTFPTREWSSLGHFTAKDERTIQTFALQPLLFGKFIRVDFHSHYGNEHFCCTTLIRVYGTSEFEVLETEEADEDESNGPPSLSEDDEDEDYEEDERSAKTGKPRSSKNLFGHATEAVFSIVKKAAAVLVKTSGAGSPAPQENAESPPQEEDKSSALCCTSPRHIVVCNNCSDETFYRVFELLSCRRDSLTFLAGTRWIRNTLGYSRVCSELGLDVLSWLPVDDEPKTLEERWEFLQGLFSYEYIAAMCNVLAVEEQKVAVNMSQCNEPIDVDLNQLPSSSLLIDKLIAQTCSAELSSPTTLVQDSEPLLPTSKPDIRPTKTIKKDQSKMSVDVHSVEPVVAQPVASASVASMTTAAPPVAASTALTPPHTLGDNVKSSVLVATEGPESPVTVPSAVPVVELPAKSDDPAMSSPPVPEPLPAVPPMSADSEESPSEEDQTGNDLDAILTEMKTLEQDDQTASTPPTPRAAVQGQKESVFLRLSNKIKALDRNMSLSGQYLEELSRRYKKQEELGRALNKSLAVLWEETRRARSREQQTGHDLGSLREQVDTLSAAVDMLLAERNSWRHRVEHLIIILIEMSIFGLIFWTCRRLPSDPSTVSASRKWSTGWKKTNGQASQKSPSGNRPSSKRRNSFDGRNPTPPPRKRRPSEEALNVTGSYKELVKQESVTAPRDDSTNQEEGWMVVNRAESRRQQKKRRKNLLKSSSTHNLVNLCSSSSPDASFYTPNALSSTEKDPQRRISVPAKVALNARGESLSGPPWQGGISETNPEWPVNVSPPTFMHTAASARSRRSVSSLASGGDAASARSAIVMAEEAPSEAKNLDLAYLPSQSNVSGLAFRTSGGSDSPRGSVSSGLTNFEIGEPSKKTKKKGLKGIVKKLF